MKSQRSEGYQKSRTQKSSFCAFQAAPILTDRLDRVKQGLVFIHNAHSECCTGHSGIACADRIPSRDQGLLPETGQIRTETQCIGMKRGRLLDFGPIGRVRLRKNGSRSFRRSEQGLRGMVRPSRDVDIGILLPHRCFVWVETIYGILGSVA